MAATSLSGLDWPGHDDAPVDKKPFSRALRVPSMEKRRGDVPAMSLEREEFAHSCET
jgi:hypothetical protein